jgi:hypothetical protein
MAFRWAMKVGRTLTVTAGAIAATVALAIPASAHTPVLLDETDTVPSTAPLAIDGTDPFSFFGTLPCAGAVRSFQLTMQAGQSINVMILVPDLAPENLLATSKLPRVWLVAPNGTVKVLAPNQRTPLPIPEINQNYLILNNDTTTAVDGTYSVIVTGKAPSRFNITTGTESEEFHGLLRGEVATVEQLQEWYATAP